MGRATDGNFATIVIGNSGTPCIPCAAGPFFAPTGPNDRPCQRVRNAGFCPGRQCQHIGFLPAIGGTHALHPRLSRRQSTRLVKDRGACCSQMFPWVRNADAQAHGRRYLWCA